MKYCIEILFGIFCMAFAHVLLYGIEIQLLSGNIGLAALVLAAAAVVAGLFFALDGFICGWKKQDRSQ